MYMNILYITNLILIYIIPLLGRLQQIPLFKVSHFPWRPPLQETFLGAFKVLRRLAPVETKVERTRLLVRQTLLVDEAIVSGEADTFVVERSGLIIFAIENSYFRFE